MGPATIIVINWNGAAFLELCLKALLSQVTSDDEILVVDNASTDDSVLLVRARFPNVKLVCSADNRGYAGGANLGLNAAQGEFCILLNPDVQVHQGCLGALKRALNHTDVGVAGCKLYYPSGRILQHAGGIIEFPRALANHHGYRQPDHGQWDRARDVDYVTGAALAMRREMLHRVGPLDEGYYPSYYEEVDYCYRVRQAGFHVRYVPSAVATHHEHASMQKNSPTYLRFFHRGRLRFVLKHGTLAQLLDEFFPAESRWLEQKEVRRGALHHVLGSVYLDTMLAVPELQWVHRSGRAGKGDDALDPILRALADLRDQLGRRRL